MLREQVEEAGREKNKWQIGGKSNHLPLSLFPFTVAVRWCLLFSQLHSESPKKNPAVQKQSLSLIRERNELLQNVIGYSCCQIAIQLPIRTFIDNMWIGTRTRTLLPTDTPRTPPNVWIHDMANSQRCLLVVAMFRWVGKWKNVTGCGRSW